MQRTNFGEMACSIARTLDVIGEPWSPLILRDVYVGLTRFEQIQTDLGISRKVLTERLNHLAEHGVLERRPYDRRPRYEYVLTDKGTELVDMLMVMAGCRQVARRARRPTRPLPSPRLRADQPPRPALCTLRGADARPRRRAIPRPRRRGLNPAPSRYRATSSSASDDGGRSASRSPRAGHGVDSCEASVDGEAGVTRRWCAVLPNRQIPGLASRSREVGARPRWAWHLKSRSLVTAHSLPGETDQAPPLDIHTADRPETSASLRSETSDRENFLAAEVDPAAACSWRGHRVADWRRPRLSGRMSCRLPLSALWVPGALMSRMLANVPLRRRALTRNQRERQFYT